MIEDKIVIYLASDLEAAIKKNLQEFLQEMEEPPVDRLLSVAETSALLGVDRTTLWRWDKAHYLTPKRFGRRIRYSESQVLNLKNNVRNA